MSRGYTRSFWWMDPSSIFSSLSVVTYSIEVHWSFGSEALSTAASVEEHEDAQYAACLFRYERKYAVLMRSHSNFACIDDKHRKLVNHGCSSGLCGTRTTSYCPFWDAVTSSRPQFYLVSYLLWFCCDIPDEVSGSWYTGDVMVIFKEGAFESSSPLRHSTELAKIELKTCQFFSSIWMVALTIEWHTSVKLALIVLFRKLDLDYLCAVRTAPYHSYRNPVERIMSILNLGLQAVGLARKSMPADMEAEASKCNNLKALRTVAERNKGFCEASLDSISPVKILLMDIARRLELKGCKFSLFTAAGDDELDELWTACITSYWQRV